MAAIGKPVGTAVEQILPYLDSAEHQRLTAVYEGTAVPLDPVTWSLKEARRLHDITRHLLDNRLVEESPP